jgi:hypothetical protein
MIGILNQSSGVLTIVDNGTVYNADRQHPFFQYLVEAYSKNDMELFLEYYNKKQVVENVINKHGGAELKDGKLYYKGQEVHNTYADRVKQAVYEGLPVDPMLRFFEKLMTNPSAQSIEQLPAFLSHENLPICEDGDFLAYKTVSSDMYSKAAGKMNLIRGKSHNGRIYNAVGEVIECPRNEVNDNRGQTCSYGLHVGSLQYSGPGGYYNCPNDVVIICKVNPRDVVSVPDDYEGQKMRVCRYEVKEIFRQALNSVYDGVQRKFGLDDSDIPLYAEITFDYKGRRRHCVVDDVNKDVENPYIIGVLEWEDPSYGVDGDETYRNFIIEKMSNIEYLC